MKKIITLSTILALTVFSSLLALPVQAQVMPAPNPTLDDACGLDIALVVDVSGSIGGDLATLQTAAKGFVDAFLPGTPTLMGLVSFSSGATIVRDLTGNATDLKNDIDALTSGGSTNWKDALIKGTSLLEGGLDRDDTDHPDLLVMFSDGLPNVNPLDDSITAANQAKMSTSSLPIRIVAVGVGSASTSTLVSISGPIVSPPAAVTKDTDVIMSNFDDLATTLGNLANALCDDANGCVDCDHGPDIVINDNKGVAINLVSAEANTGGNFADGSYGGEGGDGGDMENEGGDIRRSHTGAGGNGGTALDGGIITTGDANAQAGAINVVNTNYTEIDRCACQEENCCEDECCEDECCCNLDLVHNSNRAIAFNGVRARANTGENAAMGSYGGEGGEGGEIENEGEGGDIAGSSTGIGGTGGNSGYGGDVMTGRSDARALGVNIVNTNITRIRR